MESIDSISTETMLKKYKDEIAVLMERCLRAEAKAHQESIVGNVYLKKYMEQDKQIAELQKKNTELQQRLDRALALIGNADEV